MIKLGGFFRWIYFSMIVAAELSVGLSVNKMMTFDLPGL